MKEKIDIEELKKLRQNKFNLDLMVRHIKRLESYVEKIDDILLITSMSDFHKIRAISRITNLIKEII